MTQAYSREMAGKYMDDLKPGLGSCPEKHLARREWMSVLAGGDMVKLEAVAAELRESARAALEYDFLRKPESGLLMMQARAGNTGRRFNLGEVLVTRCVVSLRPEGKGRAVEGYAMVMGDNPRQAELAAVFDALMQTRWREWLEDRLIEPLRLARRERELARNEKTRRTKVDFFTIMRGED